ncbi:MAG: aldo/keto reductase [Magnetococcales bacterium]|nr:aldo/keto reductase [Magnetococcales bacterium]
MEYRKFGKTGLKLSVFTLGTMRFLHGWEEPYDELPEDSLEHAHQVIQAALDAGFNLIETAEGYGKSEAIIGQTLPKLTHPRSSYKVMTKSSPAESADAMRRQVEAALKRLNLDHIELFAVHGINTPELVTETLKRNGCMEGLEQMRDEGIIGHLGFATHAPVSTVLEAIRSDRFSFVNMHYYALRTEKKAALDLAASMDMGVFIISPNDKGGRLYEPSEKLRQLTEPLHPAVYNERWILAHPHVHTMSVGVSEPGHVDLHLESLKRRPFWGAEERRAQSRLLAAQVDSELDRCANGCRECLPCPERIAIPDLLRLDHYRQTLDMALYSTFRYGMMNPDDHWMPGAKGDICTRCDECLPRCPQSLPIPDLLFKAHEAMHQDDPKES